MNLIYLIILLPLLSSLFSALCIFLKQQKKAEIFSSFFVSIAALLSIFFYLNLDASAGNYHLYNWFNLGKDAINFTIKYDPLTAVMFLVVTVVSSLVHIFSIGYMENDEKRARFFCYLSLFTFAMLILVCSDNFIQLFLGWEGVGLCSYLLVGYYYGKPTANSAAIKAFLVNRVGDFGYLIAIALIYKYFGSLNYDIVFSRSLNSSDDYFVLGGYEFNILTVITMFLFMAAVGKSAQIGLHVWLPDAMEGPTPVSALIHAATMVTAGVFLIARCSPIFEYSPFTLNFITYVGLITCIFAASIALVQDDIKKIIAYSTCSQLGYMFFACGISAYSLGVYHLVTHAFFKALLFLGAGSVIHTCYHMQDIKKMGGLFNRLPITYFFMIIGTLALTGIPPLAGYFSKDLILEYAFSLHNFKGNTVYIIGSIGAALTSIYSFRLLYLVFHGKTKISTEKNKLIKEAPKVMLFPLLILAIGALLGGYIFYEIVYDLNFWKGSIFVLEKINYVEDAHHIPFSFRLIPIILVVLSGLFILTCYTKIKNFNNVINNYFSKITFFLKNKWYFDIVYNYIFVKKFNKLCGYLWKAIDIYTIDGMGPLGITKKIWTSSGYLRRFQNGKVFSYAIIMFVGIIAFASTLFLKF